MNNYTALLEITVNAHESVLSRKLVFWTSNWKHVIKYDLCVKFSRFFAHNVQMCAKFICKSSLMFVKCCEYYHIILRGRFFVDTLLLLHAPTAVHTDHWTLCQSSWLNSCAYYWCYNMKPGIERVQALTDISRWSHVVIATKPVQRLQIRTMVHN